MYFNRLGVGTLTACLALGGAVARADIVTTFNSVTFNGTNYDWTYGVTIDPLQQINAGGFSDFGTLYDFGPVISLSTTGSLSTDFSFSFSLTNTPAFLTNPTDNATLLNARFTSNPGVTIHPPGPGLLSLGTFTLESAFGGARLVSFDGQAQLAVSPNLEQGNVGLSVAPVPGPIGGAGLPGLVAACVGLLALVRRRQKIA